VNFSSSLSLLFNSFSSLFILRRAILAFSLSRIRYGTSKVDRLLIFIGRAREFTYFGMHIEFRR